MVPPFQHGKIPHAVNLYRHFECKNKLTFENIKCRSSLSEKERLADRGLNGLFAEGLGDEIGWLHPVSC